MPNAKAQRVRDTKKLSENIKHQHLYDKPIEVLSLSEIAVKALLRTGMTSIGDCIDFYNRGIHEVVARPSFLTVMAEEVKQKIIE